MRTYVIVVAALVALLAVTPAHAYCGSQIQPGGGYKWVCTPDPIPGRPGTGGSASTFGAIAYGATTGRWGYSNDYSSQAQASQRAVKECGQPDCVVRVWFRDECGALALGDNGAPGARTGAIVRHRRNRRRWRDAPQTAITARSRPLAALGIRAIIDDPLADGPRCGRTPHRSWTARSVI